MVPGAGILAARMIEKSGAELRLSSPVVAVDQSTDETVVTCADGKKLKARGAIVCLPINALNAISFTPALSPVKNAAMARGHGGKAIKVWIKARGVEVGELATGGIDGLSWMFAERKAEDGTTLIVSFGLASPKFNPDDRHAIAGALQRFFPDADLVAWDWHDWVADPYARGTWVALPADMRGNGRFRELAAGGPARLRDLRHFARPGRLVRRRDHRRGGGGQGLAPAIECALN